MRKNPHVRICGGLGSATTLVYPTVARRLPYSTTRTRRLLLVIQRRRVELLEERELMLDPECGSHL